MPSHITPLPKVAKSDDAPSRAMRHSGHAQSLYELADGRVPKRRVWPFVTSGYSGRRMCSVVCFFLSTPGEGFAIFADKFGLILMHPSLFDFPKSVVLLRNKLSYKWLGAGALQLKMSDFNTCRNGVRSNKQLVQTFNEDVWERFFEMMVSSRSLSLYADWNEWEKLYSSHAKGILEALSTSDLLAAGRCVSVRGILMADFDVFANWNTQQRCCGLHVDGASGQVLHKFLAYFETPSRLTYTLPLQSPHVHIPSCIQGV